MTRRFLLILSAILVLFALALLPNAYGWQPYAGIGSAPSGSASPEDGAGGQPIDAPLIAPSAEPSHAAITVAPPSTPTPTVEPTPEATPTIEPTPENTPAPTKKPAPAATPTPVVTPQPTKKPAGPPVAEPPRPACNRAYEAQVITLVNVRRAEHGLAPLSQDESLSNVARKKSQDMSDNNYFAHESPTYGSPFQMMQLYGIVYRYAGENIAAGYRSPESVVEGWMNSPGHRDNILNPNFTKIGVGYASVGRYWTQMFTGL